MLSLTDDFGFFFFQFDLQVHTTESKSPREEDDGAEPDENAANEDNLFEHVKKVDQIYDALVKDAATEEQVNQQRTLLQPEDDKEDEMKDEKDKDDDDVVMKEDDQEEDSAAVDQLEAEKLAESKKKGRRRGEMRAAEEEDLEEIPIEGIKVSSSSDNILAGPQIFAFDCVSPLVATAIFIDFVFSWVTLKSKVNKC